MYEYNVSLKILCNFFEKIVHSASFKNNIEYLSQVGYIYTKIFNRGKSVWLY